RKQECAQQRCAYCRELNREPAVRHPERVGSDDTQPGNLRNRKVDEDNSAIENLGTERYMGCEHQQSRKQRQAEDVPVERGPVHRFSTAASMRVIVSAKNPNRSLAPSVPPTVEGSFTIVMPAFLLSHSEGRGS